MSFCLIVMTIFKGFFFRLYIPKNTNRIQDTAILLYYPYCSVIRTLLYILEFERCRYNSVIILTGWKRRPAHLSINEKKYILYYTLAVHAWWLYYIPIYLRSYNILFACVSSGRERSMIKYLPARETSICLFFFARRYVIRAAYKFWYLSY